MYQTGFSITLPDTLTFLKEIKVFAVENGVVQPLELAERMKNALSENQKRTLILGYVLNSKYQTYRCLLNHLEELREFRVSRLFFRRYKESSSFIKEKGFQTDIASFYTARDFLYELDIINWCIDRGDLLIFPVGYIGLKKDDMWNEHLEIGDFVLGFHKKFEDQLFLRELIEVYLNLTGRRFMANADLLQLRDQFCRKHRIGDFYFKELLLNILNKSKPYKISLNFGTINKRETNYALKLTSLPKLSSNRLALYIAIEETT